MSLTHLISGLLRKSNAGWMAGFIVLIGVCLCVTSCTPSAPQQPIPFNHEAMVQKGMACLFCHVDATRSPAAGMPSMERCMGCHGTIYADHPAIQALASYWERGEPVPWTRVNQLPRFVYFSHRVHVNAGFNCEQCHGDVGHMQEARPVVRMNMGWCLSCHEQQPEAAQLRDCVVCHQ